ncbi:YdcF family protein [Thalassobacillus hwangdonensis]|uniref:YdcF family protein n=1 Tax=Thalassobacillus hwangdonensis TaxID=546108 RepID=A0ABW3L6N0_9BACI
MIKKLMGIIFLVFLVYVGFTGYSMWTYEDHKNGEHADAAIVLGAAQWNGKPSPVFEGRLQHAIDLYKDEKVDKLIVTGGKGTRSRFSEAEVGRAFMVERGIPEEDVLIENTSQVTEQNLENAKQVAEKLGLDDFLIVSDPFHAKRGAMMAQHLGMNADGSPTPYTQYQSMDTKVPFFARELAFYIGYDLAGPFRWE